MDAEAMEAILRSMIDQPQKWRERSVERLEPLSQEQCRRRISIQFRLNETFLEEGVGEAFGDDVWQEMRSKPWRQTIPLARIPKGTLLEFSCRAEDGEAVVVKNHFDGAQLTQGYLTTHFHEFLADTGQSFPEEVLAAMDAYFYLVAAVNHESTQTGIAQALGCPGPGARAVQASERFALQLVDQLRPYVKNSESTFSSSSVERLASYLDMLWHSALQLRNAGVRGVLRAAWYDPVLNPALMARGFARWQLRQGQAFSDVDAALNAILTVASRVHVVHRKAWAARLETNDALWVEWSGFFREIYLFAFAWVLYVDLDVEIERPRLVKFEFTDKIENSRSVLRPGAYRQVFNVETKSVLSKHVEIAAAEPEIEISPPEVFLDEQGWKRAASRFRESIEAPPHSYHYIVTDPFHRLGPKGIEDWDAEFGSSEAPEDNRLRSLRAHIGVSRSIRYAYRGTAFAMGAVMTYALFTAWPILVLDDACGHDLEPIALATIGMLAVLILFAAGRHRNALVASLVRGDSLAVIFATVGAAATLASSLIMIEIGKALGHACPVP